MNHWTSDENLIEGQGLGHERCKTVLNKETLLYKRVSLGPVKNVVFCCCCPTELESVGIFEISFSETELYKIK